MSFQKKCLKYVKNLMPTNTHEKPKKVTDIFEKTLRRSHIVTYSNDTSSSRKSTQYLCGIIIEQSETLCKFKIE